MKNRPLILSHEDRDGLVALIESARMDRNVREDYLASLEGELRRARVVAANKVPANVITMYSVVRLKDLDSDEVEEMELVYPAEADVAQNRISILAPIGTAILGYRL